MCALMHIARYMYRYRYMVLVQKQAECSGHEFHVLYLITALPCACLQSNLMHQLGEIRTEADESMKGRKVSFKN